MTGKENKHPDSSGLSKRTPQLPNNTLSNNPSDCPDSATCNKVTSDLTRFTLVCVHVCHVPGFQTDPALASIALYSRAEPTLDFKELCQVIGERGGDRSGGRGMKMSLIRAGRETNTVRWHEDIFNRDALYLLTGCHGNHATWRQSDYGCCKETYGVFQRHWKKIWIMTGKRWHHRGPSLRQNNTQYMFVWERYLQCHRAPGCLQRVGLCPWAADSALLVRDPGPYPIGWFRPDSPEEEIKKKHQQKLHRPAQWVQDPIRSKLMCVWWGSLTGVT